MIDYQNIELPFIAPANTTTVSQVSFPSNGWIVLFSGGVRGVFSNETPADQLYVQLSYLGEDSITPLAPINLFFWNISQSFKYNWLRKALPVVEDQTLELRVQNTSQQQVVEGNINFGFIPKTTTPQASVAQTRFYVTNATVAANSIGSSQVRIDKVGYLYRISRVTVENSVDMYCRVQLSLEHNIFTDYHLINDVYYEVYPPIKIYQNQAITVSWLNTSAQTIGQNYLGLHVDVSGRP